MNWYPYPTRNHRLNVQLLDVNKSPVSSTFGYYTRRPGRLDAGVVVLDLLLSGAAQSNVTAAVIAAWRVRNA